MIALDKTDWGNMTKEQIEDLFIEWDLYEPKKQETIVAEYRALNTGDYCKTSFFEFLRDKLEIEGYWAKVGLA